MDYIKGVTDLFFAVIPLIFCFGASAAGDAVIYPIPKLYVNRKHGTNLEWDKFEYFTDARVGTEVLTFSESQKNTWASNTGEDLGTMNKSLDDFDGTVNGATEDISSYSSRLFEWAGALWEALPLPLVLVVSFAVVFLVVRKVVGR